MLKTIEGIYQDGQVRFTELLRGIVDQSQVLVTFLTPSSIDSIKPRQLIDQLGTIEDIQQGFEQLNSGKTRPIDDFMKEMQQKYDISCETNAIVSSTSKGGKLGI